MLCSATRARNNDISRQTSGSASRHVHSLTALVRAWRGEYRGGESGDPHLHFSAKSIVSMNAQYPSSHYCILPDPCRSSTILSDLTSLHNSLDPSGQHTWTLFKFGVVPNPKCTRTSLALR